MTEASAYWERWMEGFVPWQTAYARVEEAVKTMLTVNPKYKGMEISTNELVEALFPEADARGDGIAARRRLYKALTALTEHGLKDWHYRGPPRRGAFGGQMRPYVWCAPKAKCCPHCGGELAA